MDKKVIIIIRYSDQFHKKKKKTSSMIESNFVCSTPMMAEDAVKLAEHLNWDRYHVVGVSMGGMIAQHVALLAKTKVQSLTLVATRVEGGFWNSIPPVSNSLLNGYDI
jgi:pimeloyl-ACP methyl ester carboxylesterase